MIAYLSALAALVRREPIATVAIVRSIVALLVAFWPGLVTPDQTNAILGVTAALLGVDYVVRKQTTPMSEPTVNAGEIKVVEPDGEVNVVKV